MNIIIHRYNSICEPDFIEAFETLGIEVIQDCAEMQDKNLPLETRVETLAYLILEKKPSFVFSINFFPYISMICEKLQVLYVCVSVDCPVLELYSNEIKNAHNRIFLFDYQQYLDVHEQNPECIFHMPLGVNVARINQTIGAPDWEKMDKALQNIPNNPEAPSFQSLPSLPGPSNTQKISNPPINKNSDFVYKYDVSFVGSLYNEKDPYPQMKQKLDLHMQGYLDGLIAAQSLLPGQALLEECTDEKVIQAIRKGADSFYPSDLSFCNLDRFVAVNDYLSPHLSSLDRVQNLNLLAQYFDTHLFTRSDTAKLRNVQVHGGVASLTEMPKVFRESRINLNMTIRSIQMGLPQRIWDVLGCGGFLLTNYQAELPEYLEIGKHVEAYENAQEMLEKVEYYLNHEEERLAIARAGYELVAEKHTVLHRVIEMVRLIVGE